MDSKVSWQTCPLPQMPDKTLGTSKKGWCGMTTLENRERELTQNMRKILIPDKPYKCQDCGKTIYVNKGRNAEDALILHHIIPLMRGGTTQPNNIARLCNNCHNWRHDELRQTPQSPHIGRPILAQNTNFQSRDIKALRKQLGWTQKKLAEEMRVTEITIRRWEYKEREPQLVHRLHLAELAKKKEQKNERD